MPVRILYLEDSPADVSLVLTRLLRNGIPAELKVVSTREDYTAALADPSQRPDVVMCDNAVPGYSGLDALRDAQTLCPGVHVLLISSQVNPTVAEQCLAEGATEFLDKSELWRLPYVVKRVLGQAAPQKPQAAQGWALLVQVVQQLSMARDLPTIMQIVRKAARELTGADGATFVLREDDKCYYADEDAIAPLWKGSRFPMSACISGWVMLNRQPVVIPDIYADPRIPADAYRPTFVKSLAMVPIRTAAPLGAIGNYWSDDHQATPEEVAFLSALADTTSVAMENVALLERLEHRVVERTHELEAANRELKAFGYSISHDLRSPLTAITGFTEILEEDYAHLFDDDGRVVLGNIKAASARMLTTIDALLSLARLNRSEIVRQPIDLSVMARGVISHLRQRDPNRDVEVKIQPQLLVEADEGLMTVVLENLIGNAWKYSSKKPHAKIEVGRNEAGEFFVRDNGAGFDMTYVERLFTPFQRLHSAKEFAGTGVGLATVDRIIHRHGGTIRAESTVGEGSTFYFTLEPHA